MIQIKGKIYKIINYSYAVADSYSGVNFGANEPRGGYATTGSYNVLLPDGCTQTVTYTPDMLPMFNTLVNPQLMLLHLPMPNYLK